LSGTGPPGRTQRALDSGADGYITKPIDTRTFPQQIERYLRPKNQN
jgi:DNA-binding response OmpR family regulator